MGDGVVGFKNLRSWANLVVALTLLVWMTTYFGYTYVKLVTQTPGNAVQVLDLPSWSV